MNRSQVVQAIAACDALAYELRKQLKADAAAEFSEQGTAPTWRLPGYTVSTAVTHDGIDVVNEVEFRKYVQFAYPHQIETITRPYPAWQQVYLAELVQFGDPPMEADGTIVPGLAFRRGGEFRSVSVIPAAATKQALRTIAAEIASGARPLALPATVEVDL